MAEVTSRDIMRAAGIENIATLVRWHGHEKLIPPPNVRRHPSGRGRISYWPEWVLHRCVRIKQLRKEGKSLAEIREFLGTDWATAEQQHSAAVQPQKPGYNFAAASKVIDQNAAYTNLDEMVGGFLANWCIQWRQQLTRPDAHLLTLELVLKAVELMKQGINPVLIITGNGALLTADFEVSQQLQFYSSIGEAILVIPIWSQLAAYASRFESFPEHPTMKPAPRVLAQGPDGGAELNLMLLSDFGFEIQPLKRKHRRKDS